MVHSSCDNVADLLLKQKWQLTPKSGWSWHRPDGQQVYEILLADAILHFD